MALDKIMTIHEVRQEIHFIYDVLEKTNCHIHDNSLDGFDYNDLRKAWESARKIMCAKWTNQLL